VPPSSCQLFQGASQLPLLTVSPHPPSRQPQVPCHLFFVSSPRGLPSIYYCWGCLALLLGGHRDLPSLMDFLREAPQHLLPSGLGIALYRNVTYNRKSPINSLNSSSSRGWLMHLLNHYSCHHLISISPCDILASSANWDTYLQVLPSPCNISHEEPHHPVLQGMLHLFSAWPQVLPSFH
jgi:hypothetical protein